MKVSAKTDNGFRSDAGKYAAYLETPEGRLRLDLALANLKEFLAQADSSLSALDLGCGTGAAAFRLARLGVHVTLLDSSPAMLDLAQRAAQEAGVAEKVNPKLGDAVRLADLFPNGSFDVVLCHNLLEYVGDPAAVLSGAAQVMRGPSAILSVLVRNQAGEVLKAALQAGDLPAAERGLDAEWAQESLYGGKVRLFSINALEPMLNEASLTITAQRGVRVITDYLPAQISRTADYERIFALERKLGSRGEFGSVARYRQYLARRSRPPVEDRA
jgi:S-adenosylmethionine-dependent methyltransferase